MARSVPEWWGKTDDSVPPPRVRVRVFERSEGRCHRKNCGRKIAPGERWTLEHIKALINARPGENLNRESNLGVTCGWCLPAKNAEDVAEKSKVYKKKAANLGVKRKRGGFRGWRRMDGSIVWNDRR